MIPTRKKVTEFNFICLCNGVSQKTIEEAIKKGATTLDEIFDKTRAGIGGCGGSCRVDLKVMLESFKKTGKFPQENPRKTRIMAGRKKT